MATPVLHVSLFADFDFTVPPLPLSISSHHDRGGSATRGNGGCFSSFIDSPQTLRRPLNHDEQRAVVCNSHRDDDEQQQLEVLKGSEFETCYSHRAGLQVRDVAIRLPQRSVCSRRQTREGQKAKESSLKSPAFKGKTAGGPNLKKPVCIISQLHALPL